MNLVVYRRFLKKVITLLPPGFFNFWGFKTFSGFSTIPIFRFVSTGVFARFVGLSSLTTAEDSSFEECRDCAEDFLVKDEALDEDSPVINEALDEEIRTAADFTEDDCPTLADLEVFDNKTLLPGLLTSVWDADGRTFGEVSCFLFNRRGLEVEGTGEVSSSLIFGRSGCEDSPMIDEAWDEEILTAADLAEDDCTTLADLEDADDNKTLLSLSLLTSVWAAVGRTFEEVSCFLLYRRGREAVKRSSGEVSSGFLFGSSGCEDALDEDSFTIDEA